MLTLDFDSQRETRVLLEQIHSEVKAVSEQHGSVMGKLQEHDQRFEKITDRLEKIELKLIGHDGKFDRIEKVITTVLSEHETRIKKLEEKTSIV